ncbi:MAG: hypothetical protein KC414_14085 [Romboutsia sp.]|nr:hypothetical protein [Romboutsia sp.]
MNWSSERRITLKGLAFGGCAVIANSLGYLGPFPRYLKDDNEVTYHDIKVDSNLVSSVVSYDVYTDDMLKESVVERYMGHASVVHIKIGDIISNPRPFFQFRYITKQPSLEYISKEVWQENPIDTEIDCYLEHREILDEKIKERYIVEKTLHFDFHFTPFLYD